MWSNSCQLDKTWGAVLCLGAHSVQYTHIYVQLHIQICVSIHIHRHAHTQCTHMRTYVHKCIQIHTKNANCETSHRIDQAGGQVEERGGSGERGACWWGWWWLKLDPDRGLLASVDILHKHMLLFGEVFLQTDWLTGQVFFVRLPPCDRALGSDYCQGPPPNSSHWPTSPRYSTSDKTQANRPKATWDHLRTSTIHPALKK